MTWQLLLFIYITLNTATYLFQRKLGQSLAQHKRLVSAFFLIVMHYPVGLMVAAYSSPHLAIGWVNVSLLLIGSAVFPVINVLALKASKDVDAGHYTILSNLTPVVTIVAATLLLHEQLVGRQLLGAVIIIASAFLITLPMLQRRHATSKTSGVAIALTVFLLTGLATVYERWMLTRIDFGAYLIVGWGFQSLWMAVIAWPERKHLKILKARQHLLPILGYSLSGSIKGICFLAALKLSNNASLFGAFISFTAILVVPAAYIILKEKSWLWLKIASAITGTTGLIILNTK
jgi:drug/metabolite transporter (DMT)-like permease